MRDEKNITLSYCIVCAWLDVSVRQSQGRISSCTIKVDQRSRPA